MCWWGCCSLQIRLLACQLFQHPAEQWQPHHNYKHGYAHNFPHTSRRKYQVRAARNWGRPQCPWKPWQGQDAMLFPHQFSARATPESDGFLFWSSFAGVGTSDDGNVSGTLVCCHCRGCCRPFLCFQVLLFPGKLSRVHLPQVRNEACLHRAF